MSPNLNIQVWYVITSALESCHGWAEDANHSQRVYYLKLNTSFNDKGCTCLKKKSWGIDKDPKVGPPCWSSLKYINCCMDCQETLYGHSWSLEGFRDSVLFLLAPTAGQCFQVSSEISHFVEYLLHKKCVERFTVPRWCILTSCRVGEAVLLVQKTT